MHNGEGADDGHRHSQRGDHRGGKVAQKEEDHHDDQADRQTEGELDVMHGFADHDGTVIQHVQFDRGRHLAAEGRQKLPDVVHNFNGVGSRLALDGQDDGAGVVVPACRLGVLDTVEDPSDLLQADR